MKYIAIILLLFVTSCTTNNKTKEIKPYLPSLVSEVYIGCFNSVKYSHISKFNVEPNPEKVMEYCDCAVNKIQREYSAKEFADLMSKQDYSPLKKSTTACRDELKLDNTKPMM